MNLGELIAALDAAPDRAARVYADNKPPVALASYRGYYDQLAIQCDGVGADRTEVDEPGEGFEVTGAASRYLGSFYRPGSHSVRIVKDPTVADLLVALHLADGETFEGYKGGQFTMHRGTDVWASEYGECSQLLVSSLEILPGRVDLFTTKEEW